MSKATRPYNVQTRLTYISRTEMHKRADLVTKFTEKCETNYATCRQKDRKQVREFEFGENLCKDLCDGMT